MGSQSDVEQGEGNSNLLIGTLCAVVGNFMISFSFQLQRLAHRDNSEGIPYTRIPTWWMGFLLMACGEVGNFMAYGMAPASLVSPMGAIAVVANAVLSRVVLKEELSGRKLIGVLVALAGSIIVAFNAPAQQHGPSSEGEGEMPAEEVVFDSLISWRALIYLLVVLIATAYIANPMHCSWFISNQSRQEMVILNCVLCGLMGAITVMSSKGVSTALNQLFSGNTGMLVRGDICWLTYILIICAVGSIVLQMKYLNEALMHFGSSQVVPVYFVVFTSITISTGMVLFLETEFEPLIRSLTLFVLGLLLSFAGVYLINSSPDSALNNDDDSLLPASREELKTAFEELKGDVNVKGVGDSGCGINIKGIFSLAVALGEEEEEQVHFASSLLHSMCTAVSPSVSLSFSAFEQWYHTEYARSPADPSSAGAAELTDLHQRRMHALEAMRERKLKAQTELLSVFSPLSPAAALASAFHLHRTRTHRAFPSALELDSLCPSSARSAPSLSLLRSHPHRPRKPRAPGRAPPTHLGSAPGLPRSGAHAPPPGSQATGFSSVLSRGDLEAGPSGSAAGLSALRMAPAAGSVMVRPQELFACPNAPAPDPATVNNVRRDGAALAVQRQWSQLSRVSPASLSATSLSAAPAPAVDASLSATSLRSADMSAGMISAGMSAGSAPWVCQTSGIAHFLSPPTPRSPVAVVPFQIPLARPGPASDDTSSSSNTSRTGHLP